MIITRTRNASFKKIFPFYVLPFACCVLRERVRIVLYMFCVGEKRSFMTIVIFKGT